MTREEASPHDRESDIRDVPLLRVIDSELHTITKRTEVTLIIALALNLAVVVVLARLHIKSMWLDAIGVAIVVMIVGGSIFSVVVQKLRVAAHHGLVCSMCAHAPSGDSTIMSAATSQRCRKCRARLPIATRGQCPFL